MKPGIVTGCTNPAHTHFADVAATLAKMNQCTFVDDSCTKMDITISRKDAQNLVDSIRCLQQPGMYLDNFMLLLTRRLGAEKEI